MQIREWRDAPARAENTTVPLMSTPRKPRGASPVGHQPFVGQRIGHRGAPDDVAEVRLLAVVAATLQLDRVADQMLRADLAEGPDDPTLAQRPHALYAVGVPVAANPLLLGVSHCLVARVVVRDPQIGLQLVRVDRSGLVRPVPVDEVVLGLALLGRESARCEPEVRPGASPPPKSCSWGTRVPPSRRPSSMDVSRAFGARGRISDGSGALSWHQCQGVSETGGTGRSLDHMPHTVIGSWFGPGSFRNTRSSHVRPCRMSKITKCPDSAPQRSM